MKFKNKKIDDESYYFAMFVFEGERKLFCRSLRALVSISSQIIVCKTVVVKMNKRAHELSSLSFYQLFVASRRPGGHVYKYPAWMLKTLMSHNQKKYGF